MSNRFKCRTMPYLPRYKPLSSANRRPRFSYPGTASTSRELIYYIDGRPARVINSYQAHNVSSSNKACRIFLCCPSLGHYLTRVTGNTSCDDSSSSHVYTNPGNLQRGSSSFRQRDDEDLDNCQDIFQSPSCCLDMTPSESGVSVGESEDWSVFGHESDNISQRSSNSWSTFCEGSGDNDIDRIEMDNLKGPGFLRDMTCNSDNSCNDDKNFVNESYEDLKRNNISQDRDNKFNRYLHSGCGRETPTNSSLFWHDENAEDQFPDFPEFVSNLESHPGILSEVIQYNVRQTEHTPARAVSDGCEDRWLSETRDSAVCDTSRSSECCCFADVGKLDSCTHLFDLERLKCATNREDLYCGNGLSEDNSHVLNSTVSSLSCDVWVAGARSNIDLSRTHGSVKLTKTHSDNEITKTDGGTKVTESYCDMELARMCGDLEVTRICGDPDMTMFCSGTNSLAISCDENTHSGRYRQCRTVYKMGQVVPDGDLRVQNRNQPAGETQTGRFTNWEDEENKARVRLHDCGVSRAFKSTNRSEMLRESSEMFSGDMSYFKDDRHTENDLLCLSDVAEDDDVITLPVSDLMLPAGCVVDTDSVRYGSTTGDANLSEFAWLNTGECFEEIPDTNSAPLLLPPEMVNQKDVNKWDLSGIIVQRGSNNPESYVIDSASERSDARAQQTPLQQSSMCHRDYATVDWRINNNNTSTENLIDSSQADTKRLPYPSGFWEETQSSQTVFGKTESIENKYQDISTIADPSNALHVKQRIAGVTQQLKNQLVISFDFCDTFEKSYSCVYCSERTKRCLYGLVCANCVFHRCYSSSLSDDEKVISSCYRREDIDSCAEIPASILDESIKHADEKRRINKGAQHVRHFCAESPGVGSGKIDEIIRYNRAREREVSKSSAKHTHTVDDQSSRATERVDISLLSILESDKDKPSDNVLSQDSNKLDSAPTISESCQTSSWNDVFLGLAAQDTVSIDKIPANTLLSARPPCVSPDSHSSTRTSEVPSDLINSTSSPKNKLRIDEYFPSVSPVITTSLDSSILSRHTTSYTQTMKENCSMRNTNNSTSNLHNVVTDSSKKSRANSSLPAGLFTDGCHVNPLDNLHAQLSFISGIYGSAGSGDSGYVGGDVYQDHAEATYSWKLGTVNDAKKWCHPTEAHTFKETTLNPASGKDSHCSASRSHVWKELSQKKTDSLVLSDTQEEYDNADTYITAETHRGSRLLPRHYHNMPLFKYGQAKVSSLWTVLEEPENVCEETFPHSSSALPVDVSTIRNTGETMLAYRKPYKTENMTSLIQCNSTDITSYQKCILNLTSTMSLEENYTVFDDADNRKPHISESSEEAISSLLENDTVSCDVMSATRCCRLVEDSGAIKCGDNEVETSNRFLVGEDKNNTTSCSANHPPDIIRQECGDSSGGDPGERNDILSKEIRSEPSPGREDVPEESYTDNQSVLDRLSQSLSQISNQHLDSVFYSKSVFREDATDSFKELQECDSNSYSVHGKHRNGRNESDLMCNISCSSDLDSNTSSASIGHIQFSSSGKAEFKDTAIDDYDNPANPGTIRSGQKKTRQTDLDETGKCSDFSIHYFDKIVDELNISMSHIQEIAEMMLPQNQSTTKCEELYQAFTNEEAEKQQNHGCIVLEDEDTIKYRFKRFLKKSHSKRKKGLKIVKFFSRLGCVSGVGSPPTGSPVMSRKQPGKWEPFVKAETELLPGHTSPGPVLINPKLYSHPKTVSMSLVGNCSSSSSSNQSLDSVPSKADSAYSSFSESTEAAANNLGSLITTNSQVDVYPDHPMDNVNMDFSIVSCSSSVDFSSSSSDVGVIHLNAIDSENIRTTSALKLCALTCTDIMTDVFDELNTCEGEIDTALLYNMRYGHTPAKIDKTWG